MNSNQQDIGAQPLGRRQLTRRRGRAAAEPTAQQAASPDRSLAVGMGSLLRGPAPNIKLTEMGLQINMVYMRPDRTRQRILW
jgi:hypothetical protein